MGRAKNRDLDRQDLRFSIDAIGAALRGLDRMSSESAKLTRLEIEEQLIEIYAKAKLGVRHALEMLRRNDHGVEPEPLTDVNAA